MSTPPDPRSSEDEVRLGTLYGIGAYGLWGFMPLLFHALKPASSMEILTQRIVWSFAFCVLLWIVRRDMRWLRDMLADPRRLVVIALASALIAVNWGVFIYAVNSGNVIESSLGYFINPLVTVLIGVLVLNEKLRRMQWIAIAFGAVAVSIITFDYGRMPYIALSLAVSFSAYSYIKNRLGGRMGALEGLTVETFMLVPLALGYLVWWGVQGDQTFTTVDTGHTALLVFTGPATAIPLLFFSAAARRVPLSTIGLLQFMTPIMQLIMGVFVFGEHQPLTRWIGFVLVWIALAILTTDSFRAMNRRRRERRSAEVAG